jgi:hypothetical protein
MTWNGTVPQSSMCNGCTNALENGYCALAEEAGYHGFKLAGNAICTRFNAKPEFKDDPVLKVVLDGIASRASDVIPHTCAFCDLNSKNSIDLKTKEPFCTHGSQFGRPIESLDVACPLFALTIDGRHVA